MTAAAALVDVRRLPPGCGWSIFRQHFASGSSFASSLGPIGRHYADYVATMALWDERLPGAVHRVTYERLVAETESEVRRARPAVRPRLPCLPRRRPARCARRAPSRCAARSMPTRSITGGSTRPGPVR